ncbi:MAG: type II toxin-antitoxin system VapC family toxin [Acidimicrobiales bacterium]
MVVDASVLVELVTEGRHRRGADALLSRYASPPRLILVSAAHALVEAINALRRLTRLQLVATADASEAVEWLRSVDLLLDPTALRAQRIWELRDVMTAYDAAYAAAAEALRVPLVTVDHRLARACREVGIEVTDLDDFG